MGENQGRYKTKNKGTEERVEVAKLDPTRQIHPIRPDLNPTRFDPTRDQMAFNPIEIYQRSEKTQHVN
jgi:hypothetical protein